MSYNWPGNVRELENCIERSAVMSESGLIDRDVILFNHRENTPKQPLLSTSREDSWLDHSLDERQRLIAALEKSRLGAGESGAFTGDDPTPGWRTAFRPWISPCPECECRICGIRHNVSQMPQHSQHNADTGKLNLFFQYVKIPARGTGFAAGGDDSVTKVSP